MLNAWKFVSKYIYGKVLSGAPCFKELVIRNFAKVVVGNVIATVKRASNSYHCDSTADVELIPFIMSDADLGTF